MSGERPDRLEKRRNLQRAYREILRQRGVCTRCAARPAHRGSVCDRCRNYAREWAAEARREAREP